MYKDIRGQRFGRLRVLTLAYVDKKRDHRVYWKCLCDCGAYKTIRADGLQSGHSNSCGCLNLEMVRARRGTLSPQYKHGKAGTKIYKIYKSIKNRCGNSKDNAYSSYGGRGIKNLWTTFEDFYRDMGDVPTPLHSIDRINNDGNYCKENCRWATRKEQCNNRRSNVPIEFRGRTQNMKQWAEEIGISHKLLWDRIRNAKWSVEKSLTQKPRFQWNGTWKGVTRN